MLYKSINEALNKHIFLRRGVRFIIKQFKIVIFEKKRFIKDIFFRTIVRIEKRKKRL